MKRLIRVFVFIFILVLLPWRSEAGETYYVSPQGSDSNSGSINSPLQSLWRAIRVASAGDTIIMRGGTYSAYEVWITSHKGRGGAPGRYLTIKAYPGEEPVLQRGERRLIINADFVRVEGLHFVMPWRCDAFGRGIQIINNKFTGPQPRFGAIQTGGEDILIEGNLIQYDDDGGNTRDHGIYVHGGERITIRNNQVIGAKGYGIHLFDEHKSSDPGDWAAEQFVIKDYIFEGNFIASSQTRSGMIVAKGRGGDYITLENITIRNNVFVGNTDSGLYLREGHNIQVYNNIFYDNGYDALSIDDSDSESPSNITIKNNIFVSPSGVPHVSNSSQGENVVLENNLYDSGPHLKGITDPRRIIGEPQFVNAHNHDFHLQASSPAIDAGVDLGFPFVGSAPDLGAYEFGQVTTDTKQDSKKQPVNFNLHQKYPNPFNPETKILFEVAKAAIVTIKVYDITGNELKTLVDEKKAPGLYSVIWNGTDTQGESVAGGVYLYRFEVFDQDLSTSYTEIKKMILLR